MKQKVIIAVHYRLVTKKYSPLALQNTLLNLCFLLLTFSSTFLSHDLAPQHLSVKFLPSSMGYHQTSIGVGIIGRMATMHSSTGQLRKGGLQCSCLLVKGRLTAMQSHLHKSSYGRRLVHTQCIPMSSIEGNNALTATVSPYIKFYSLQQ